MKKLFTLIAVLAVAGCANYTPEAYKQKVMAWISASESELIGNWGVPDKEYTSGNRKFLAYIDDSVVHYNDPAYSGFYGTGLGRRSHSYFGTGIGYSPGYTDYRSCETTFILTKRVVTDVHFRGNGCRAETRS